MLLLGLLAPACGGGQQATRPQLEPDGIAWPHIRATDDGRVVVDGDLSEFGDERWFHLTPERWPENAGSRPILGMGRLVRVDGELRAVEWAVRSTPRVSTLRVVPTADRSELMDTKLLMHVARVEGNRVTLSAGEDVGVAVGDVYFVLNRANVDLDEPRFGDAIGALLRVTGVERDHATARIEHADVPVAVGQPAAWVQTTGDRVSEAVTLLFAELAPSGGAAQPAGPDWDLPPLAGALPEYLAEYRLTNIQVQPLNRFIDPRPWDAAITAEETLPRDGFGTLVFGQVDGQQLIYNATAWGSAPNPDNTVGILPGGLALDTGGDVTALSRQLVPSFVATALGLRGDHAVAVYLLETTLRRETFDPTVRYHLREHLALRYHSIGRTSEALRLMNHDIAEARDADDAISLLNALSIRGYLDQEAGLLEQWISDSREFLRVAQRHLPAEALDIERLSLARALRASGDFDEADTLMRQILLNADARADRRLRYFTLIHLAFTQVAREQSEAALLVLDELESQASGLSDVQRVSLRLIGAEIRVRVGMLQEALQSLTRAFEGFDTVSDSVRADMLQRAAGVLEAADRPIEAARALRESVSLLMATGRFDDTAATLAALGMRKLEMANEIGGGMGLQLVLEGRSDLLNAAELLRTLGRDLDAAQLYALAGVLDRQLRNEASSNLLLQRAEDLGRRGAAYALVAEIHEHRAQTAYERCDYDEAQRHRANARAWAEAGGLSMDFPDLTAPVD